MSLKAVKHLSFIFVLLLLLAGCRAQTPEVLVQKKNGDKISVSVEVMRTKDEWHLGLMYRKSLKKDKPGVGNPDGHFKIPHLWPGQNPPPSDSRTVVS